MVAIEPKSSIEIQLLEETIEQYGALVSIDKREGNPPNYIEITYRIPGYVPGSDDQPKVSKLHRVSIELPLGYPATFPLVKPLTPLFHPEVGNDAYGIAMRWHEIGSLSELVLCIGKIICGELYNIDSLLNPVAATWYKDNAEKTRLSVFEPPSKVDSDVVALLDEIIPEHGVSLNEQKNAAGVSEIDESVTYKLAGMDDEEQLDNDIKSENAQQIFAHEEINNSLVKKKIFTANRLLASLGSNLSESEHTEYEEKIGKEIVKANMLHEEIMELEEREEIQDALSAIDRLMNVAVDFPGLSNFRTRIKRTQEMSQAFSLKDEKVESPVEIIEKIPVEKQEKSCTKQESKKSSVSMSNIFVLPDLPSYKIIGGIFGAVLMAVFLYMYIHDGNILAESQRNWQRAQDLILIDEFKQALQAADEAKDNLSDVLMMVGDKEELIMEIDNVLVSKDFIEGLHGKALYEGEYVEFDKIVKLKKLQDMTVKAETFKELGELDRAIDCYEEARLFATFKGLDSHAKDLQQEISNLRLGEALVEAKSAEGEKNWRDAAEIYKKALDVAHSVSGAGSDEEQRVINQYLTVALFRYQIEQSKQIFADENWREAVDVLSQAEKVIRENQAMITPEEKEEFERLYVHARFYLMLYTAKKAYEQGNWDTAIENYNIGLRLLQEKGQYFGDELLASKKKVGKTMLMTKVARELSLAAICENQDDPSGAIAYYYHVIKMLTDNSIGNDKEFKRVIDNTRLQIDATENRKIIKEKVAWLKKNYVNIFKKHYPSANVLFLLYPEVTLIKKEHDKMVFHMSCVEKSNGRSFRLVLDYVNMLKTNDWNLYAGK